MSLPRGRWFRVDDSGQVGFFDRRMTAEEVSFCRLCNAFVTLNVVLSFSVAKLWGYLRHRRVWGSRCDNDLKYAEIEDEGKTGKFTKSS